MEYDIVRCGEILVRFGLTTYESQTFKIDRALFISSLQHPTSTIAREELPKRLGMKVDQAIDLYLNYDLND